jgi:hypothetical protein
MAQRAVGRCAPGDASIAVGVHVLGQVLERLTPGGRGTVDEMRLQRIGACGNEVPGIGPDSPPRHRGGHGGQIGQGSGWCCSQARNSADRPTATWPSSVPTLSHGMTVPSRARNATVRPCAF